MIGFVEQTCANSARQVEAGAQEGWAAAAKSCKDSILSCWKTRATAKDVAVPLFSGEKDGKRDSKGAHEWMKKYCRWAVQEGLSADQTLLIAVEHFNRTTYNWAGPFLFGATWETFMLHFYREYITKNELAILRVLEWYQSLKSRKAVPFVRYSCRELRMGTENFAPGNIIGEGGFGVVYKAYLPGNQLVAVKKLKGATKEALKQAHNEVEILSQFRHPNLVRLLGCCLEKKDPLLVYEYIPNGNLQQHLSRQCGKKALTWKNRMAIAIGTAEAITHLHNCGNSPVYHRDVKSNNILLDFDMNAKVADFGLSKFVMGATFAASHITTAPQGTHGYLDPCYLQTYHLTDKSDVYSFGIVLLELVAGMQVLDVSRPEGETCIAGVAMNKIKKGRFDLFIDPHLRKKEPACLEQAADIAMVAMKCLSLNLNDRPSMKQVLEELHCIRDNWVLV